LLLYFELANCPTALRITPAKIEGEGKHAVKILDARVILLA